MATTQERHCSASIEEAERYASPVNCWLMIPLPQEMLVVLLMSLLLLLPLLLLLLLLLLLPE